MKAKHVFLLLISLVLMGATWTVMLRLTSLSRAASELQDASPVAGWEGLSQVSDAGAVRVRATPVGWEANVTTWDLVVSLDTHSVNLDYDLLEVTRLRCEQGTEFEPITWEGSPPGGHHREGTLRFAPLDHESQYLELVIRGVGQVPERSFRWEPIPAAAPRGS